MIAVIRLLLAFELSAKVVEEAGPPTHGVLPLGGSDLAQLGIALVVAVLLKETWDAFQEARVAWRRRHRRKPRRRGARRLRVEPAQKSTPPANEAEADPQHSVPAHGARSEPADAQE